MNNIVNQVAYLRSARSFPEDLKQLTVEINKTYVDIANAVNNRTISIFPVNRSAITGESWFLTNQRQQTLRQVYTFTGTTDIPIGFKFSTIDRFTRLFGTYTDGTNWYGIIPATSVAIAGQITFYIVEDATPGSKTDLIRFVVGAGAPALTKGTIVLEWLSLV